jgi:hypothetical protein
MNIRDKIFVSDYCAIIGNGPSLTDLSSEIDNSYVMRCNSFKISKLTGTRTDLNITALYHGVTGRVCYPIFGVLPISYNLYQKYSDSDTRHINWFNNANKIASEGNDVWMYGDNDDYAEVFKSVAEEINAFPTVGLMGIATARWMGFPKIIITGFTFFKIGYDRVIIKHHHNPDAEIRLVNKWIETGDYLIDELTKKVLNDNR